MFVTFSEVIYPFHIAHCAHLFVGYVIGVAGLKSSRKASKERQGNV